MRTAPSTAAFRCPAPFAFRIATLDPTTNPNFRPTSRTGCRTNGLSTGFPSRHSRSCTQSTVITASASDRSPPAINRLPRRRSGAFGDEGCRRAEVLADSDTHAARAPGAGSAPEVFGSQRPGAEVACRPRTALASIAGQSSRAKPAVPGWTDSGGEGAVMSASVRANWAWAGTVDHASIRGNATITPAPRKERAASARRPIGKAADWVAVRPPNELPTCFHLRDAPARPAQADGQVLASRSLYSERRSRS